MGVACSPFGAKVYKFRQKTPLQMGYSGQPIAQKYLSQTKINYSPLKCPYIFEIIKT